MIRKNDKNQKKTKIRYLSDYLCFVIYGVISISNKNVSSKAVMVFLPIVSASIPLVIVSSFLLLSHFVNILPSYNIIAFLVK